MPHLLARHAWLALTLLACTIALTACQSTPQPKLSPAQVTVLKTQGFALTDHGWELGLPDKVLFGFDEDTITAERQCTVIRVGRALSQAGIDHVRVDGHTDDVGTVDYNQRLSVHRAEAVARVLGMAGFARDHVEVRGWGKTRPVSDNATPAGRAENRRVSIIVTVD